MALEPTHHIKHKGGWELDLYISPENWAKAQNNSSNDGINTSARDSIAIRFKEAARTEFHGFTSSYVRWDDLTVTPIQPKDMSDQRCCDNDNCVVCDMGNHQWCPNGCTIG